MMHLNFVLAALLVASAAAAPVDTNVVPPVPAVRGAAVPTKSLPTHTFLPSPPAATTPTLRGKQATGSIPTPAAPTATEITVNPAQYQRINLGVRAVAAPDVPGTTVTGALPTSFVRAAPTTLTTHVPVAITSTLGSVATPKVQPNTNPTVLSREDLLELSAALQALGLLDAEGEATVKHGRRHEHELEIEGALEALGLVGAEGEAELEAGKDGLEAELEGSLHALGLSVEGETEVEVTHEHEHKRHDADVHAAAAADVEVPCPEAEVDAAAGVHAHAKRADVHAAAAADVEEPCPDAEAHAAAGVHAHAKRVDVQHTGPLVPGAHTTVDAWRHATKATAVAIPPLRRS
ncbi:hypothetical protein C8Q74DRAFT_1372714 [Fomes fomentarius]|nr:hypothetical protein C8Q74DRAFT_1372714 [Fomes fomentarius]